MKTVVMYRSKYGHTREYVGWLAEATSCVVCEGFDAALLADCDTLVFASSVYGNVTQGLKEFETLLAGLRGDIRVAVLLVGLSDPANAQLMEGSEARFNERLRRRVAFFHVRGGLDYKNLGFLDKRMLGTMKGMIKKRVNQGVANADEQLMFEAYSHELVLSDKAQLAPLLAWIKGETASAERLEATAE